MATLVCFSTSFQNFGCLWNFPEEREADTGTIFHQVVAILSTEDELNGEEFRKSCRVCIHQYSERKIRKEKDDEVRHFLKGFLISIFLKYLFMYLSAPGLSEGTQDLRSLLWHANS